MASGSESTVPVAGDNPAEPLVVLGETQLMIKAASANNYDTQGLGLLAFNGAVLAANIAAKDLLERLWWMSMIGIGVSIGCCIGVLKAGSFDVGKGLAAAARDYGHFPEAQINALLVDDLGGTLHRAEGVLQRKSRMVGWALVALLVAALLAAISALRS